MNVSGWRARWNAEIGDWRASLAHPERGFTVDGARTVARYLRVLAGLLDRLEPHASWCNPQREPVSDRTCTVPDCYIEQRWAAATCMCQARGWTPRDCVEASDGMEDHPPMAWVHDEAHLICLKCGADGT